MDEKPTGPIPAMSDLSGRIVRFGLSAEQASQALAAFGKAAAVLKAEAMALGKELQAKRP